MKYAINLLVLLVIMVSVEATDDYGINVRSRRASSTIILVQSVADFRTNVIDSKEPVIVLFYNDFCGPCKVLLPRLQTAIGRVKNIVHLARVDVDKLASLASAFKVTSLPTVVGIKNRKEADRFVGLKTDDQILDFLHKLAGP